MDSCLQTLLSYIPPLSPIGTSESICICMFLLREHHRSHTLQDSQETPVSHLGWFLTHSVTVFFMGPGKKDRRKGVRKEEGKEGRKEEGGKKGGREGREGRFFLLLLPQATYKPS